MADRNKVTRGDMALIPALLPFTDPENIPLYFYCGKREIRGIPPEFKPKIFTSCPDCNINETVIVGENGEGLEIRAEYIEYRDFPVTEWVAYITNKGDKKTPVLSKIKIGGAFRGTDPVLIHGNGDCCTTDGYEFFTDGIDKKISLSPVDGTPCNGAFPYMRLMLKEYGVNIAVGWPAQWEADFVPEPGGIFFTAGQQRAYMFLNPGETIRTPRVDFMGFTGGESKGGNMWRRWYLKHILPREDGGPVKPKICLHSMMGGMPEFTGITEENQLHAINTYIDRGLKPDVWWIDAGWYRCDRDWTQTGTWRPDPDRMPNGLAPVGALCDKNDIKLLLWFEPERVRSGTEIYKEHPSWLLHSHDENGKEHIDSLLNLGNAECCDWITEKISCVIKENHVRIYRQDFNYAPLRTWIENEGPERIGALENFHVQGYLRYWDGLLRNNPGLLIDSCASGGRRNDLETMRRAVPLQYTDVGLGLHPVKQKQHREMFEWIPYFRAHTMNWDNEDGDYEGGGKPVDEYAYQCAMAPAITSMIEYNDGEALFEIGRRLHPVWREAAELMLSGDYYPLTECRKSNGDYYAMQFDDPASSKGFIQVVRNTRAEEESITVFPYAEEDEIYDFGDHVGGSMTIDGNSLKKGFTLTIPKRSGVVWFYHRRKA